MWPAEIGKQKCHCTSGTAHESLAIPTPEDQLQTSGRRGFQDGTEDKDKNSPQNNQQQQTTEQN